MSFLWVFFAQFSLLTVTLPRQRLRAGADLDNEGGEAEWAGNIISRCGNGRRDESETCDDGNLQDGDGCDRHCHLEIPRGCEKMFDRLSWQRWANRTVEFRRYPTVTSCSPTVIARMVSWCQRSRGKREGYAPPFHVIDDTC
eukprot:COSAG02_NODE_5829_length_4007_cov_1.900972_3_plen_142_part_00